MLPLDTPIIDALPRGPVDELLLAAPFIDRQADAVAALLTRLQPAATTVVLQEHLGQFDRTTVTAVLTAAAGQVTVVADRSTRHRHAKLIEWSIGNRRWAITGSALLRTAKTGGNIELAVLDELTTPIWPPPGLRRRLSRWLRPPTSPTRAHGPHQHAQVARTRPNPTKIKSSPDPAAATPR